MANIRFFKEDDYQGLKNLLEKNEMYWEDADSEDQVRRRISRDPESMLVAEEDDKIVGSLYVITEFAPSLFRLSVDPDYQGRGIGTALGTRGEEILRSRGYKQVSISVNERNKRLLETYEKNGFDRGNAYVWMTKKL